MASDGSANQAEGPASSRRSRAARRLRGASGGLSKGLPVPFVAALAALVLIAILFTVASRDSTKPRGFTEITLTRGGCVVDPKRQVNVVGCRVLGPRQYSVLFSKSLAGSTPIASRGSCCPGPIGATATGDRTVVIALARRVKAPVRASVLIP